MVQDQVNDVVVRMAYSNPEERTKQFSKTGRECGSWKGAIGSSQFAEDVDVATEVPQFKLPLLLVLAGVG